MVFGTDKQIMIMVLNLFKYLKDPAQPILDALDKDSSPKDDAWDSVSIVSFPENKQEDILQNTLNQSTDPSHQPVEGGPWDSEAADVPVRTWWSPRLLIPVMKRPGGAWGEVLGPVGEKNLHFLN